jgi:hypothetical protein
MAVAEKVWGKVTSVLTKSPRDPFQLHGGRLWPEDPDRVGRGAPKKFVEQAAVLQGTSLSRSLEWRGRYSRGAALSSPVSCP